MRFSKIKILSEIKRLWKAFLFLFLLSFLIFNWAEISWIFNYKAVSILLSDFFQKREEPELVIQPTAEMEKKDVAIVEKFEYTEKQDSLEIPRIEISAPIFLINSQEEKKVLETLDRGVVLFSDFSFPGQPGRTIILGHSARRDWPKTNPAWVFTYLRDVIEGDEIIVHFNHRQYPYSVTRKFILKEGEEILPYPLTNSENILTLITCWPPGRLAFKQRLVVEASIQK